MPEKRLKLEEELEDELWQPEQPELDSSNLDMSMKTIDDEQLEISYEGGIDHSGEGDEDSSLDMDSDSLRQVYTGILTKKFYCTELYLKIEPNAKLTKGP